jgi:hypothetical protein
MGRMRERDDSAQYGAGWLGIARGRSAVRRIPLGIGPNFQYQLSNQPNSRYYVHSIPIPISKLEYIHPNRVLERLGYMRGDFLIIE